MLTVSPILSLVPRRVQFTSTSTAQDQLSTQIAQDSLHAPLGWKIAKDVLREGVHGIIEVLSEPGFSLLSTDRQSPFRPFDTPPQLSLVHAVSGPVTFSLGFDSDAFHKEDAKYMLDHLVLAFQQLLAIPTLSHTDIDLMSDQEHAFVQNLPSLIKTNKLAPPEDPARYCYAHDLLSRQVSAFPDKIAIEWEGNPVYTYTTLDATSNQLARYLVGTLSVRPGDIVILFLHQSPLAVAVIYALLKVGAAYFPLDVDTPTLLFRQTVESINSKLFLTVEALEVKLHTLCWGQTIIAIDQMAKQWSPLDSTRLDYQPLLGDPATTLAYINLTSGSTGLPKKCMISHSNLVHWVVEAAPGFGRTTETRQLQVQAFLFFLLVVVVTKSCADV